MKRMVPFQYLILTALVLLCVWSSPAPAGEAVFSVPAGKKARIVSVKVTGPDKRFKILEKDKGWTVYRSWGDANAVSGLVLSPGRYEILADDKSEVLFDCVIE